ncbi:MAG: amidohydrolase family protein [Brevundimonas sp.]|uniref:amidohydrolase family protein n=1 Tax=Brevundimonas sp. TaxID=1871086 RepID=UPI0011F89164|nr:amidohydrolase family protein [Brevundimonas sp.]RZJ16818.1 MAG: amidohydrolase family protein [Brevundimonas sp.]
MKRLALCLAAAAAVLSPVLIPQVASAQNRSGPVTLVRAGNLFDSEAGRMVGPRDLLIQRGRITEVGQGLTAPEGATVVDLSRCSVLPGLIDAHTHLLLEQGFNEGLADVAARDNAILGDAYRSLRSAPHAKAYLHAGFTAVRDLGNAGRFLDVILSRAIRDGHIEGPRMYVSGPPLSSQGGQIEHVAGDPHHLVDSEYRVVRGVEDARQAVREAIAGGANVIKVYAEATPQRTRLSVEELTAVVTEAKRHGLTVAAHATSDAGTRDAVMAGVTSIEHGYAASDATLRLMAQKGVWLVPTDASLALFTEFAAHDPEHAPPPEAIAAQLERQRDRLRRARAAGVKIAAGSDGYYPVNGGRGVGSRHLLDAYVESGMTPAQALQSATVEAAAVIGDARLGVLKAGNHADLIAMPGDPTAGLAALRDLKFVMQNGRIPVSDNGACGG